MKRIIALFIAAVMLFAVLPVSAELVTDNVITYVPLTIRRPLAGATPVYDAECSDSNVGILEYNSKSGVCKGGVSWFDVVDDRYLQPTDTFVKGRIYELRVHVYARVGNRFDTDRNNKTLVTATVNGSNNTNVYTNVPPIIEHQDPRSYLYIYYRFAPCTTEDFGDVALLIDAPVSGNHPSFDAASAILGHYSVTTGLNVAGYTRGVVWEVKNGDQYSKLADTDIFVAGKTYSVTVRIAADPGYYIPLDSNNHPYASCRINGQKAYIYNSPVQSDAGQNAIVTREFVCSSKTISTVAVSGAFAPEAGINPCYDAAIESSGYQVKSVTWTDTVSGDVLNAQSKFVEKRGYTVAIALETVYGCTFAAGVSGTLNGDTATTNRDSAGIVTVYKYYVCPESKVISVVRVDDVTLPSRDGKPVYTASVSSNAKYSIDLSQDDSTRYYIKNGVQWADRVRLLKFDDTFNGGTVYFVTVFLAAKNGYRFDDYAHATLNGYEADFVPLDYIDGETAMVVLYCDKLPVVDLVGAGVMVSAPEAGKTAQFTAQPTSEGYIVEQKTVGSFINGVAWYDETGEKYLKQGDKFVKDHEYRVHVMLTTENEGYRFETASLNESIISGFVNGHLCSVDGAHDEADTRVTLVYSFSGFDELDVADFNRDGRIDSNDAVYLLRATLFPDQYQIYVASPFYGSRTPKSNDAVYLLRYTLFPETYSLFDYPNKG